MRIITCLLLLTLSTQALAQDSTKRYTFNQIGWTITIPDGFIEVDSAKNRRNMERGLKAIEESSNVTADISEVITLFSATKNTLQYFTATLTPFDPEKDGDYAIANKDVKEITFNTFRDQMPNAKLDTSSRKINIDGLEFDKFNISIKIDELPLTVVMIFKLYKGYDFGISYLYMDEETQKQIEASISSSKFRK